MPLRAVDGLGRQCEWQSAAALLNQLERQDLPQSGESLPALMAHLDRLRAALGAQQLAPCPAGWSRLDYAFGFGEECAVPVQARRVSALLLCVFGTAAMLCDLYQLWRKRAKGETLSSMYRTISLATGAVFLSVLWAMSSLMLPNFDTKLVAAIFAASVLMIVQYSSTAAVAFLTNAIDTVYSLRPQDANIWHGRLVQTMDALWVACLVGICLGCGWVAKGAESSPVGNDSAAHRGLGLALGSVACNTLVTTSALALAVVGTGRAARALGASLETQHLRRKLRRQRTAALVLALLFGASGVFFWLIALHPPSRRVAGTAWAFFWALASAAIFATLLPGVLRSVRRLRAANRKRRASVHAEPEEDVPVRRLSAVEASGAKPGRYLASHQTLATSGGARRQDRYEA